MRRAAVLVVAGLVGSLGALLAAVPAQPAAAHGAGGVEATSYVATVGALSPALAGVRLRQVEPGRLELANHGAEVVVLGDQGEAYLRVGPDGTFENRRSPAAARNRASAHDAPPGSGGAPDPGATPDWRKLGDQPVARWHDHRLHWVGPDPPQVEADPGRGHEVVAPTPVVVQRGAATATATVGLAWVPGRSPAPWLALAGVSFLGVAAVGLLRRWRAPLVVVVGLLLAVDLVHAGGAAFATAGGWGSRLARVVTGDFYAIVGWALAVAALRLLTRGRVDGLYAAVFAGLSIALFGGLLDLAVLTRPATLFALPIDLARACIALAAGGGAGLVAACALVIRRTPEARVVLGGPDVGAGRPPTPVG